MSDLPGVLTELDVGAHRVFVEVGWKDCRPVFVDLKLSLIRGLNGNGESAEVVALRADQLKFVKASLEIISRQSSFMLERGILTLAGLCEMWRGTQIFYGGACPGLDKESNARSQVATGPLDAAARLIEQNAERWQRRFSDG